MAATYANPWHKPGKPEYGPAAYVTDATPTEYGGHLIYRRLPDCYDVVKGGVCVTQMAGPNGARRAIDAEKRRLYPLEFLAAHHLPDTDWPVIDLLIAGGLDKTHMDESNGQRRHRLHDRRTGQSWGTPGDDAALIGLALARLNGLTGFAPR
jgi:hypothetical protein